MPYSEADFERMKSDPLFTRQYVWSCAMRFKAAGYDADYLLDWSRCASDTEVMLLHAETIGMS